MTRISLALAATLLASTTFAPITAFAQNPNTTPSRTTPGNMAPGATSNAPMPGVSPSTGATPGPGVIDRNSGAAAASGDRNQAVTTTGANAAQPARGSNSFTQNEARRRLERNGFQGVSGLTKDNGGVWRGSATKDGQPVQVWLDYKGNTGQGGGMATNMNAPGTTTGMGTGGRNLDGTTGNPPGTAAGRAMDRNLGTNTTGANPAGSMPDGTPGNPAGTAAGRAMDRTLGTNTTGANPGGGNAVSPNGTAR